MITEELKHHDINVLNSKMIVEMLGDIVIFRVDARPSAKVASKEHVVMNVAMVSQMAGTIESLRAVAATIWKID